MWRNARCLVFGVVVDYQVTVEDRSFRGTLETTLIYTEVGLSEVYYCISFRNRSSLTTAEVFNKVVEFVEL